jgi:hypothetical protein
MQQFTQGAKLDPAERKCSIKLEDHIAKKKHKTWQSDRSRSQIRNKEKLT